MSQQRGGFVHEVGRFRTETESPVGLGGIQPYNRRGRDQGGSSRSLHYTAPEIKMLGRPDRSGRQQGIRHPSMPSGDLCGARQWYSRISALGPAEGCGGARGGLEHESYSQGNLSTWRLPVGARRARGEEVGVPGHLSGARGGPQKRLLRVLLARHPDRTFSTAVSAKARRDPLGATGACCMSAAA